VRSSRDRLDNGLLIDIPGIPELLELMPPGITETAYCPEWRTALFVGCRAGDLDLLCGRTLITRGRDER
jgi:hypothetical protein